MMFFVMTHGTCFHDELYFISMEITSKYPCDSKAAIYTDQRVKFSMKHKVVICEKCSVGNECILPVVLEQPAISACIEAL